MVKDDEANDPMVFPDLNKALMAETTDENQRLRMEQLLKYKPLKEIFNEFQMCLGSSPSWKECEFWFCNSMIEWMDYSRDSIVKKMQHRLKFLEQGMHPTENPRSGLVLGVEPVIPERCRQTSTPGHVRGDKNF